jgi:hypothetical protein
MRPIEHCRDKHAFRTLAFRNVAVLVAEATGYADIGYGFLVGYVADIIVDLLTIEVGPLRYPSDRAD